MVMQTDAFTRETIKARTCESMEGSASTCRVTEKEVDMLNDEQAEELSCAVREEVEKLKKFIAIQDAVAISKATKGFGTDEQRLIEVLCNRTKPQMQAISEAMVEKIGRSLISVVQEDVSGNFGRMVAYALMDVDDLGAKVFQKACKGAGTDTEALIDLCMTHTKDELAAIKVKWEARYNGSLIDTLNSEFGTFSKHARKLLKRLFFGDWHEGDEVDETLAEEQAKKLYKAGVGKRFGTDDEVFIDVLLSAGRNQIQAIKAAYERNHEMSLKRATEKETSRSFEATLLAMLRPCVASQVSYGLRKALQGMGTDKERICRLLGGTDKQLLKTVSAIYLDHYGQTISESLKDETMVIGDFKAATLTWIKNCDPTNGLEYEVTPSDPKHALHKHLKEREALREHIAQDDATLIYRAVKGFGTDDKALISVICGRTKPHLRRVDHIYHEKYSQGVREAIQGDCSGYYKDFLVAVVAPQDDVDALFMYNACKGIGTDEAALVELLAPRRNARVRAMKAKYTARYDQPLIDRLNSELSGNLKRIIIKLLKAERDEDAPADPALAEIEADELYEAGVGSWGTDESKFIDILCRSSRDHIEVLKETYEHKHSMSLRKAIEKETSGDFKRSLIALQRDPINFYVQQLENAFKGLGTDDKAVVRILAGHDMRDLKLISANYLETKGKTLVEVLKSELSGNFRRAAIAWVSSTDPVELTAIETAMQDLGSFASSPPTVESLSSSETVKMTSGQAATLENDLMNEMWLGLGWQTDDGCEINLDAGVVCLDTNNAIRFTVCPGAAASSSGIYHDGDSLSGGGDGDNERIRIMLNDLPPEVATLIFTVHNKNGQDFQGVNSAYVRMVMPTTGHVCAIFNIEPEIHTSGLLFAMLRRRSQGGWVFASLGRGCMGNAANEELTLRAVQAVSASTAVKIGDI